MNKKGFTLVELLGVLVILAIIFAIVSPLVTDILSESKDAIYQKQIDTILNATYDFSLKNLNCLPEYDKKTYITLAELKYEGMIDSNITDPITNEKFADNLVISIYNVGAGYKYSDSYAKLEGDYLYKVEIEKLNDSNILDLLPTITLDGLTQNSDGNYIMTLDLNDEFTDISYSSTSYDGTDLTERIKKYILLNDTTVDNIDTSNSGIYKIYYTVVDDYGYANTAILNIIIADTISPTIKFSNENTINKDITSLDLLKDVSCEDNSGYCYIETSGEINFGVIGKYIITYTVKDPSGNTTTQKRVITIE